MTRRKVRESGATAVASRQVGACQIWTYRLWHLGDYSQGDPPMSKFHRRDFLTGAAAIAAGITTGFVGTPQAEAGDPSFMNNTPDPLVSGKELPTFKFALEKSEGKVIGNSVGKEATVEQLPISKGVAGVSMRLEPGAMRELHWHATAAEWAFVLEGR